MLPPASRWGFTAYSPTMRLSPRNTMPDRFGTLRSILQQPPCKETWDALRAELALWGDEALERDALPYALSILARWPDDIARAPYWWDDSAPITPLLDVTLQLANQASATDMTRVRHIIRIMGTRRPIGLTLRPEHIEPSEAAQLMEAACELNLSALCLHVTAAQLTAMLPALLRHAPALVTLELWSQDVQTPLALEHIATRLGALTTLTLNSCALSRATLTALATRQLLSALTSLKLDDCQLDPRGMIAWLNSPALAHLTTLGLASSGADTQIAQTIATSPHMASLTSLDLRGSRIGVEGARALAASRQLTRLTQLDLGFAGADDALDVLFSSPHLRQLRALEIQGCVISPAVARRIAHADWPPALVCPPELTQQRQPASRALARCPGLRTLAHLHFRDDYDSADDLYPILSSPHLTGVRTMDLDADAATRLKLLQLIADNPALSALSELTLRGPQPLTHADLHTLTQPPHLAHLTRLKLRARMDDDALLALLDSPHLTHLTQLIFNATDLTAASIRALLASPLARQLQELALRGEVTDEMALAIAHAPALTDLPGLSLTDAELLPATLAALFSSPHLRKLRYLHVYCPLGDEGITALAASPHLLHMSHTLSRRGITAATLPALLDSPHLPQLRRLDLSHNPLGDAGAAILAAHPALLHLDRLLLARTGITLDGVRLLAHSPHIRNLTTLHIELSDWSDPDDTNAQADAILLTSPHLSPALRASLTPR
jgi:hypothetical protein